MPEQILLLVCTFGAAALGAYCLSRLLLGTQDARLRSRLAGQGQGAGLEDGQKDEPHTAKALLVRLGQVAARPFMPKTREKQSALRRKLAYAGVYSPAAMRLVTGCKVLLLGGGLLTGYLIGMALDLTMLGVSVGGLAGYMLPVMWLRLRIKAQQKALTYGLPDALDLMVVCVEAGLTVDSALQRVGQELALAHPALSRELEICHMETRVGLARSEALKNLGQRTGSHALQSLTAMLVQADRFGTSIAQALRVHADGLRAARQHAAEEMASKASVKMSFPLVLFIFPATFIVLAGPTVIKLMTEKMF